MLYNVVLVSAVQQSETVIHTHISTLFFFLKKAVFNVGIKQAYKKENKPSHFIRSTLNIYLIIPV